MTNDLDHIIAIEMSMTLRVEHPVHNNVSLLSVNFAHSRALKSYCDVGMSMCGSGVFVEDLFMIGSGIGKSIYFDDVEGLKLVEEVWQVSWWLWRDVVSVLLVIVGAVIFLYGANYYDATVGWAGFWLFIGGFVVYLVLKAYEVATKGQSGQKP